jgi:hypothetical protein
MQRTRKPQISRDNHDFATHSVNNTTSYVKDTPPNLSKFFTASGNNTADPKIADFLRQSRFCNRLGKKYDILGK